DKLTGEALFNKRQFDVGAKTILGDTGAFDDQGVVDLILKRDTTSRFLARKVATFFVADQPDPDLVERLASLARANALALKPVLRALFLSPEFSSEDIYRARVKSPTELVVGLVKHLGVGQPSEGVAGAMDRMGQRLFAPPNVAGWPGGNAWVSTSTLLTRI